MIVVLAAWKPQRAAAHDNDPKRTSGPWYFSLRHKAPMVALGEPRRIRNKEHLRFVIKQPCLICGRSPCDPHHLRFVQTRALGRKASDEFVVPLCRGHHRELHRCGDEAGWWKKSGIDPMPVARLLWLTTHPLRAAADSAVSAGVSIDRTGVKPTKTTRHRAAKRRPNNETKPISTAALSG